MSVCVGKRGGGFGFGFVYVVEGGREEKRDVCMYTCLYGMEGKELEKMPEQQLSIYPIYRTAGSFVKIFFFWLG